MRIPSQSEYETNEWRRAVADEQRINRAPLRDRKEAQATFREVMASDPAIVAERISWLIDGNYGFGQMQMAKKIVANPRLNREAGLTHLAAVYEWQCPGVMAVAAWKTLSPAQKKALSEAIAVVVAAAERGEE